jgi:hypothetical protein
LPDLIELSTRHNFVHWLALGITYRGWARSASGETAEGIPWIEQGTRDLLTTGAVLGLPFFIARKAEAPSQLPKCMHGALVGSVFDAQHQFNLQRGICREDVGCSRLKARASGTMIGDS